MPSSPPVTACTAAVFVTMVKTMSLRSATSRGLSAHCAPASSSGSAFSRVRFQTCTVCPAARRRRVTELPITPRPTYPSSAIHDSFLGAAFDAVQVLAHRVARRRGVARSDRVTHGAVLDDRALRALRHVYDGEERLRDDIAHRLHAVQEKAVAGRFG